ncbi:hypothetical protein V2J09_007960 [Rumex salicifolius]
MGCCLSKTNPVHNPPLSNVEPESKSPPKNPPPKSEKITEISAVVETENKEEEQILEKEKESLVVKEKEEFVNQPRKSHDKRSDSSDPESNNNPQTLATNIMAMAANGAMVRTSSCTKEEVDAILIQCGRLSRSSSGKCGNSGSNRKYSGSKRSHDFDKESSNNNNSVSIELNNCDENEDDERQRRRQSRGSHRRTTPSRSRERDPHSQKSGGGGRRLSQSPRKRSEATNNPSATTTSNGGNGNRPGKLVSVPATVSSMSMEKSNNGEGAYINTNSTTGNVKRVLVRRNVTPPRSRSPVVKNSSQNQPSPNRNPSRKAEHSPYRRTPLTDLDMNSLPFQPLGNKSSSTKSHQKSNGEASVKQQPLNSASQNKLGAIQGSHRRAKSRGGGEGNDAAQLSAEQLNLGPTIITRTRSQRRSRDLDVESLSNPNPATNYTSLLLQDIQNFHQKGSTSSINTSTNTSSTNVAPFKLPDCVSKACSIVEAVADLNLNSSTTRTVGGRVKDDDLMEPSLQKFVTVGKGKEFDEREESSGSNSINVGGGSQNQWVSSSASSWEMSSEGVSPASFQRIATTTSSNSRSGVSRSRAAGVGRMLDIDFVKAQEEKLTFVCFGVQLQLPKLQSNPHPPLHHQRHPSTAIAPVQHPSGDRGGIGSRAIEGHLNHGGVVVALKENREVPLAELGGAAVLYCKPASDVVVYSDPFVRVAGGDVDYKGGGECVVGGEGEVDDVEAGDGLGAEDQEEAGGEESEEESEEEEGSEEAAAEVVVMWQRRRSWGGGGISLFGGDGEGKERGGGVGHRRAGGGRLKVRERVDSLEIVHGY